MISEQLDSLEAGWREILLAEMSQPYMRALNDFLVAEKKAGKNIFPPESQWFSAFRCTPLNSVKVVIVGQDPYHRPGQAHGLSFSVPTGITLPPSLKNIYKELFGKDIRPTSGDLTGWAKQGVLLLNASLTVEEGLAGSHATRGWLRFTEACVRALNKSGEPVVFLAWGRFAHGVCKAVDGRRHRVIKTSHPSPLGASKSGKDFTAFLGSDCFTQANLQLAQWGRAPIDWNAQD